MMDVDVKALKNRVDNNEDLYELRSALLFAINALEEHDDEEVLNDIAWEIN